MSLVRNQSSTNFRRRRRDHRHLGVAVEVDFLEVVRELQILDGLRLAGETGVPAGLADRLALRDEARDARVVAQEVGVQIHDELIFEPVGALLAISGVAASAIEASKIGPIDLVHHVVGGRHAGRGLEEAGAGSCLLLRQRVAEILEADLDLFLLGASAAPGYSSLETICVGMVRGRRGLGGEQLFHLLCAQQPHDVLRWLILEASDFDGAAW